MDQSESPDGLITDDDFAQTVRTWLNDNLTGDFARLKGKGGPGSEHEFFEERLAWDRHLAAAGWTCLGWPTEHGGRGATLAQQVVFHQEYAKSGAPARVSHVGEELLGPTLIAFGTEEQKRRFLPGINTVTELWAQGYSEPGAGSDLANVATTARRDGDKWVINGQKVWTSLAHVAQWAFVLCRTEPGSKRHQGLSFLLVPLDQPGVTVRPIQQLTGTSEFNEVFFDDAVTDADLVVGEPGDGWRVAMGLLTFERGVSTLGQQIGFARELQGVVDLAKANGAATDPNIREKIARAWVGLRVMRAHALRTLEAVDAGTSGAEASVAKLLWANWHRDLGQLAMDVQGEASLLAPADPSSDVTDPEHLELGEWQRLFLFTRADTIYGGSNEIQRNIISERVLGLPREARS
ncbi:acyl-CoA dehydrogenase family protein [Rhodococcus opacus]|uniref:Acyl-CoA dehydrogenase family protein n=1 Tax=Rhodococcus opacus TaxID=37919 RepID=A0AAX3YGH1_RHOOP|nr:acyl-CoA dehydrogenase family protein [Rhodococcus opacus]MBA8958458.1 acyl-CoA dehydrogenase [Rhodococcus opacus]MBP2204023.1 acyl-CoA dehydrogenase [Rhodococcus opacus]MCZ4587975.1 acyl-CoA dehydrogenase family protein [Rhodococcus opacus]MDV6243775.1 acyl-CoA dehydrogenase family protein [Rhodococcus opacus]UZG56630.1 acyl-CoA dehydrogenase family protein [Rhodococcus opacus]